MKLYFIIFYIVVFLVTCATSAQITSAIVPNSNSLAKGAILYVVVDSDDYCTTHLLASDYLGSTFIQTSAGTITTLTIEVYQTGEQLSLTKNDSEIFRFYRNGDVVAEISPDDNGSWNHWGPDSLYDSQAYEILLLALTDEELNASNKWAQWGYWRCVWQILKCEAISLGCLAAAPATVIACASACTVTGPACIICMTAGLGGTVALCDSAWDCWSTAWDHGCIPSL